MKKVIKLTESDIHRIVKNSVKRVLKENYEEEGLGDRFQNAWNGLKTNYNIQDVQKSASMGRQDAVGTVCRFLEQALRNLEGSYGNKVNINRGIYNVKEALNRLKQISM